MNIIEHPSPNHGARPDGAGIDLVVIHGTGGASAEADVEWLCDEAVDADGKEYDTSLSYHYVIGRDGRVWRLVEEDRRAWHAGASAYNAREDVNDFSIGIGLSNRGPVGGDCRNPGIEEFPTAQILAAADLIVEIGARYRLPWRHVVTHAQVSPGRKTDPWLYFPFGELAGAMLSYQRVREV